MMKRLSSKKGFTLVEIMIVVAIIGILVAIAIPGFINARKQSRAKACQEGQQKVQGAAQEYMLENNATSAGWDDLVGEGLYLNRTPTCPYNGDPIEIPDADSNAECPNSIAEHAINQ